MVDKKEIRRLLQYNFKTTGTISIADDGLISTTGSCILETQVKELPVAFDCIGKDFDCSNSLLESTKGFPKHIRGNFYCRRNKLVSCEGMPHYVDGGVFY